MRVPRCLTIAGSDSGGGAGIQADLKAFAAAGCYGTSAIVALTAQNTVGVRAVHEVPPDFATAQLDADVLENGDALLEPDHRSRRRVPGRAFGSARRRPGDGRKLRREAARGRCDWSARDAALSARDGRDAESSRS